MKKTTRVLFILAILPFLLASCSKADDGKDDGDGTGNNGSGSISKIEGSATDVTDQVDSVYMFASMETVIYEEYTVAKGAFKNNAFAFDLPTTIDERCLTDMSDNEEGIFSGLTISDRSAKVTESISFTAIAEGKEVGSFYYTNMSSESFSSDGNLLKGDAQAYCIYTDKDFQLTGVATEEDDGETYIYTANCSFKKGWNMYSLQVTEVDLAKKTWNVKVSTSLPSGMKWLYNSYNQNNESTGKRAQFNK